MKRGNIVALLMTGFVAGLLPAQTVTAQESVGDVSEGARVYGNMCGRCHNPRSPLEFEDRSWVMIANHMRVRGNLTGTQMRDVIAFVQASNTDPRERAALPGGTQQQSEVGPADTTLSSDPEVLRLGKQVVQQRACLGCHIVEGEGGAVGPALDGVIRRKGAAFVIRKLADPTFNTSRSMMPNFALTDEQIRAVASYLATLRRN